MRVLVLGNGGREHALCWKIAQSPQLTALFCAPGNGGIAQVAECLPSLSATDKEGVLAFAQQHAIDLVIIGPEDPLVQGMADYLTAHGIACFGPSAEAARMEGSKAFTKDICAARNIRTAACGVFTQRPDAEAYIRQHGAPIVVKADGLAAGKGVTVAHTEAEALDAVADAFSGRFGAAGQTVVIEEFLDGVEVSFFALSNGHTAIPLGAAQDHKTVGEGDTGPNTGGMGTYSPAPMFTETMQQEVMQTIIQPTVDELAMRGTPFRGVLFAGLMLTAKGIYLLEYNVRFGDPETQVLMQRIEGDILPIFHAIAHGTLPTPVTLKPQAALCVVMAAKGYPGDYTKGTEIKGLPAASLLPGVTIFHAGTRTDGGMVLANGGRVLGVTALGTNLKEAQSRAYQAVDAIDWPEGFCRRDIGWRAIES